MIFNKRRSLFGKKLSGSIGKPKDLWKALKPLGLSNKVFSCEVSTLKINNTVEHDANSVLAGVKNYYLTLAENLVKMLPKAPNKYSINTVIKYYEHMIQGYHFNLASISENSILTILKSTQVSKAAGLDSLSGRFLKHGEQFVTKLISDLWNLSINSEKFPDLCEVAKLKPLYKRGSLTQPCNYRPIFVISNIQSYQNSHSQSFKYLSELEKFIIHLPI